MIFSFQSERFLEQVMGIEPTWPAWKAGVLPLNYARGKRNANVYSTSGGPASSAQALPAAIPAVAANVAIAIAIGIAINRKWA